MPEVDRFERDVRTETTTKAPVALPSAACLLRPGEVEQALDLAEMVDATVHVLAVVDTTASPLRFDVIDVVELDRTTERLVDEVVDTYGDRDVEIRVAVRRTDVPVTVVRWAGRGDRHSRL